MDDQQHSLELLQLSQMQMLDGPALLMRAMGITLTGLQIGQTVSAMITNPKDRHIYALTGESGKFKTSLKVPSDGRIWIEIYQLNANSTKPPTGSSVAHGDDGLSVESYPIWPTVTLYFIIGTVESSATPVGPYEFGLIRVES